MEQSNGRDNPVAERETQRRIPLFEKRTAELPGALVKILAVYMVGVISVPLSIMNIDRMTDNWFGPMMFLIILSASLSFGIIALRRLSVPLTAWLVNYVSPFTAQVAAVLAELVLGGIYVIEIVIVMVIFVG